ncbi:MAG: 4Fe-4S binding protein [Burkholderiales bacterium]|nr:4Fe-4S binding protein [Anaerolineae bacterium]
MYGLGILKGLGVTLKHFVNTYVEDIRLGSGKFLGTAFEHRQGVDSRGLYTVEYPDEKIAVPERFRFVPFLVVEDDDHPDRPGHDWCTSCGICAKVCPPQCIWIVRGTDAATGRPKPEPEAFYIDIDICMNCGFCAEFCPFDAIKMDHDYELATYDRTTTNIHDKEKLSKPFSYWKTIAPTTAYEEMVARGGWEHTDIIKERKKADAAAAKAAGAAAPKVGDSQTTVPPVAADAAAKDRADAVQAVAPVAEAIAAADAPEAAAAPVVDEEAAKAERLRKREAAMARKHAKKDGE